MSVHSRSVIITIAALAGMGLVGTAAVVGLGLYNVSARAGHFPGVGWILHSTYRNSVDLRAPLAEPPADLEDPDLVALGAKHFESACRMCHAAPGIERTATIRSMMPEPPHITEAVGDWSAGELHWIVHEGVKMSGMPGWPAARVDDVWPVVAYLRSVETMSPETHARLTAQPDLGDQTHAYCATCHGADGDSGNGLIPRLDILSERYMARALAAYRSGERASGIMQHASSEVAPDELARMAALFAEGTPEGAAADPSELAREGEAFALMAIAPDVPACASCHGPWPEPLNEMYPSLSGQHEPYLVTQLHLWRAGTRGGSDAARLMHEAASHLTDEQIDALAAYYASLAPTELNAGD